MVVPEPDSAPDFGAGPCAGPKIYEILKFDELWIFSVFSNVNGVSGDFVGLVVKNENLMF